MTAVDQDAAAERSARELERRLRMILPPSLLADAYAFAAAFVRWQIGEHWRCWPPPPAVITPKSDGVPPQTYADELEAVRKVCETASSKHRSKET